MSSPDVRVSTLSDAFETVAVFDSDYGSGRVAVHIGADGVVRVALRFAETASIVVEGGAVVAGTASQGPSQPHARWIR